MTSKRIIYGPKIIKIYLRSKINQDRLTSMAILNIENNNLDLIDLEDAIVKFAVKQIGFFFHLFFNEIVAAKKIKGYLLRVKKKHTDFDPKNISA